jgi:glycosyltransferase involved in cell wall biosynthesis
MKEKRILYFIDSLKRIGGAEQMFIDSANYFYNEAGIDVHFGLSHSPDRPDNRGEPKIGRDPVYFYFKGAFDIKEHLRLRKYIKENDIKVLYPYLDFSNNVGRVHKIFFNPFVRVVIVEPGDPRRKTKKMRIFDWLANFFVHKVFAMGGAIKEHLDNYLGIHKRKILAMRNGVHEMIPEVQVEKKLSTPRGEPMRLFHVGNMDTENKGHEALVRTVAILKEKYPDVNVVMTFVGDGHMRGDFEKQAKDLGVGDRITFTGWVKHDRVKEMYGESDLFLFNSQSEGGAASIMEATSAGLPTVTSNFDGVEEVTKDGETGYVVKRSDAEAFAKRTAEIYSDDELRKRLGRTAHELYKKKFAYGPSAQVFIKELFE